MYVALVDVIKTDRLYFQEKYIKYEEKKPACLETNQEDVIASK